jgi:glutaredoxin 3
MAKCELYGTRQCPYTQDARDWLEWNYQDFVEYDVESDREALVRMLALTAGQRTIPVLVEEGKVTQVGWQGRGCVV